MYARVLREGTFRWYLLGALTSGMGDAIASIGFLLIVYSTTHSGALTTGVALAEALPYLLFGLLGGAVRDRLPRLPLMISLDLLRGLLELVTGALVYTGHTPYLLLVGVVFLLQTGGCFFNPAHRSLLPEMVDAEHLPTANTLVGLSATASPLIAPGATAVVLAITGPGGFFLLDAASDLLSMGCLLAVRARRRTGSSGRGGRGLANIQQPVRVRALAIRHLMQSLLKQFAAFGAFAGSSSALRVLLSTTFMIVLWSTWARQVGLLLLAQRVSSGAHSGAQLYAWLMGLYAGISLLAGLALPLVVRRPALAHYLMGATLSALGVSAAALPVGTVGLVVSVVLQGAGLPSPARAGSTSCRRCCLPPWWGKDLPLQPSSCTSPMC